MVPQTPQSPERPSNKELLERAALVEKDRRIAELERLLEQSRRGGKHGRRPFRRGRPRKARIRSEESLGRNTADRRRGRFPPRSTNILVGSPLFCPHCEGEVKVRGKTDQYQTELPRPRVVTRHFEIHVGRCTGCGRTVQKRHRLQTSDVREVGTDRLGPELIATAAHMNKVEGLSYGRVSALLERLYSVTVSRSGLARSLGRLAKRGEPSYEILKAQLRASSVVYPDETGWKTGGRNAWLQGVTDGTATTVYQPVEKVLIG